MLSSHSNNVLGLNPSRAYLHGVTLNFPKCFFILFYFMLKELHQSIFYSIHLWLGCWRAVLLQPWACIMWLWQFKASVMTAWHPACLCRCFSSLQQGERKVVTREADNYTHPQPSLVALEIYGCLRHAHFLRHLTASAHLWSASAASLSPITGQQLHPGTRERMTHHRWTPPVLQQTHETDTWQSSN